MHILDDPLYIIQLIQITVVALLIRSVFLLGKSIKQLEQKFRKSLLLILFSLLIYVLLAIAFSVLIHLKTDYGSYLWILPPVIGLVGSFVLILGGRRLLKTITEPEE